MRPITEPVRKWLRQNPWAIILAVLGFIWLILEKADKLETIRSWLGSAVKRGLEIDWTQKQVSLRPWFAFVLFVLVVGIVLLAIFLARAYLVSVHDSKKQKHHSDAALEELRKRSELAEAELKNRSAVIERTLKKMMGAAAQIREQLFGSSPPSKKMMHSEGTYLIFKNFDMAVTRNYKVLASTKPLHFMEIEVLVEDEADPVEFLDAIRFKVHDGNGNLMPYLPSRNDVHHKSVIVYFLPEIDPSETKPREVVVTYAWPGGFKKLGRTGVEDYVWTFGSAANLPSAVYRFFLEEGTGKVMDCRITGSPIGVLSKAQRKDQESWKGWEYRLTDASAGRYKVTLELKP